MLDDTKEIDALEVDEETYLVTNDEVSQNNVNGESDFTVFFTDISR